VHYRRPGSGHLHTVDRPVQQPPRGEMANPQDDQDRPAQVFNVLTGTCLGVAWHEDLWDYLPAFVDCANGLGNTWAYDGPVVAP
jgi:hypothetical protein